MSSLRQHCPACTACTTRAAYAEHTQPAQHAQHPQRAECTGIIEYIESWWIGAGPDSGRLTLVMECAENGDLRVPVQAAGQTGKHLEEVLILSWLQQMLRGLDHVHQKEIIHRDLKAMNVFLKDTWRTCKLGDFGISTALKSGKSASGCVGTPAYMAPELLWNQRYASAVDMWAIGVVLYELMALKLPFCGSNVLALVYQIAFNTHDPEPLQLGGYSAPLVELVARLLDKDPTQRPSACQLLSEPLWDSFSFEAAGTLAAASFNESLSSNLLSHARLGELCQAEQAEHVSTPGLTVPAPQMPTGTGSDWGDAIALLASVRSEEVLDSITGERIPSRDVEALATASLGSYESRLQRFQKHLPIRATLAGMECVQTEVTAEQLWDGLQKTRHESNTVERGRKAKGCSSLRVPVAKEPKRCSKSSCLSRC